MSELTKEQLERIARNREQALQRRKESLLRQMRNSQAGDTNVPGKSDNNTNKEALLKLISRTHFVVIVEYEEKVVDLLNSLPEKSYDPEFRRWVFPMSCYRLVASKLKKLITVSETLPGIVQAFSRSNTHPSDINISKIDQFLLDRLLPFQEEGIRFGISKNGRCLIADETELGKTIQALGIADYYKNNWPLLIICPAAKKHSWREAIISNLPRVSPHQITLLETKKDCLYAENSNVVITTYELARDCKREWSIIRFGVIIMDESYCLKNFKSKTSEAVTELAYVAKNVILLTRIQMPFKPCQLFAQLNAIDRNAFSSLHLFGIRYCNARLGQFGWNYEGSSNMDELEMILRTNYMIRRTQNEIGTHLPLKIRKIITLDPTMIKDIKQNTEVSENTDFADPDVGSHEKEHSLYYSHTAAAKVEVVCKYIEQRLASDHKILVFAYHALMIDPICKMLDKKNVTNVRFDGAISPEMKKISCTKFQKEKTCRIAVLNICAPDADLILNAATLAIFAELFWTPGDLIKAEDLAIRFGQAHVLRVEYLIAKGTADDILLNLIQKKAQDLNINFDFSEDVAVFRRPASAAGDYVDEIRRSFLENNDEDEIFCKIPPKILERGSPKKIKLDDI